MKAYLRFVICLAVLAIPFLSQAQVSIFRGPYLQKATQNSIVLRWMTNYQTGSKVSFGFEVNQPIGARFDTTKTWDHSIELNGLIPNTRYYYSIESMDSILGEGENFFFETLPESGEEGNYSFLVLGDAGVGSANQKYVSSALESVYGNHHNGVILLGDNAYDSGTQEEYQYKFFDKFYDNIIENTVIWPAPGNHDYYGASIPMTTTAPYFDIFDLPTTGECGGVPSFTEQYYSFDYGNIHFLSLDSYAVERDDTAQMAQWVRADLEANQLPWVIAYWHHPPYSKGSHDSDNASGWEPELVEMRENIVPILEFYNVDLVLSGHSHAYERSGLIANHYGSSESFSVQNIKSMSSGDFPAQCPYIKYTDSTAETHQGTVYSVVGVSGKVSGVQGDWPHPVMYSYSNTLYGGMHIEVQGNQLIAEFLTKDMDVYDRFVMLKDVSFEEFESQCIPEFEPEWSLFPNPTLDEVVLERAGYEPLQEDKFAVYDLQGRLVFSHQLSGYNTIDLRNEPAGIYVLKLEESGRLRTMKFVKL